MDAENSEIRLLKDLHASNEALGSLHARWVSCRPGFHGYDAPNFKECPRHPPSKPPLTYDRDHTLITDELTAYNTRAHISTHSPTHGSTAESIESQQSTTTLNPPMNTAQ